jgi:hypothetical protein
MSVIKCPAGFQFDQDTLIDKHVCGKVSNLLSAKPDWNFDLSKHWQPGRCESHFKGRLINRFNKPMSQLVVNLVENPNYLFRQLPMFKCRIILFLSGNNSDSRVSALIRGKIS